MAVNNNADMNATDTFQVAKHDTTYTYKQRKKHITLNTVRPMTLLT